MDTAPETHKNEDKNIRQEELGGTEDRQHKKAEVVK